MRRQAARRSRRDGRLHLCAKRRAGGVRPRCRRRGVIHQRRNPGGVHRTAQRGRPAVFPPLHPFGQTFRLRTAGVARNRGMLRTAGHRRPAAQDRRAFRTAPHRDNPAAAGRNGRKKSAGSQSGRDSAGRHRMGLAAVVRQSQGAVRIARNPRLRRDRQSRPRPEQIHRPRSHRKLPVAFRPHLLCLRHGPHPLRRSRRHRLPRRPQIRRADRLDAAALGGGLRRTSAGGFARLLRDARSGHEVVARRTPRHGVGRNPDGRLCWP